VGGRLSTVVLALLALLVLSTFMVAGSLDPPSRLKARPATATAAPPR
jgi:hypothetical protein